MVCDMYGAHMVAYVYTDRYSNLLYCEQSNTVNTEFELNSIDGLSLSLKILTDSSKKTEKCTLLAGYVVPRAYEKRACNLQCVLCMRRIIDESAGYAIFSHDLVNRPLGNTG